MISAVQSAVQGVAAAGGAGSLSSAAQSIFQARQAGANGPATPFANLLTDTVGQVNQLETEASRAVTGMMTGNGVDVHQAMIATEKASMAFELALAVRNKAVQAYQSVMGMQS